MNIIPAIDLRDSCVVRLFQGDYSQQETYSSDPLEVARGFEADGAEFLHVVDLDGAKDGALSNFDTIKRIVEGTGLSIEVGGGIRTIERIERYLEIGVNRVILGTAAVKDPAFLDEALATFGPQRIVVGVDTKDGKVAVSGWLDVTELDGIDYCRTLRAKGVETVIFTDISCDGTLAGPNFGLYRQLALIDGLKTIASGGVTRPEDVAELSRIPVDGAIIGKAIYEGIITVSQALAAAGAME